MNIAKIIFGLVVIAVIYWFASDMISPYLRVNAYEKQKTFGDSITFDITMINFSPRPKNVYIGAADSNDISLLIDGASPAKQISKDEAASTVTLAPFSNKTIKRTLMLAEASGEKKEPQVIAPTVDTLTVIGGQHGVRATLGGHTSDTITFGVR